MRPRPLAPILRSPHLALAVIEGKGRGVIATQSIPAAAVIEVAPALRLLHEETRRIEQTAIENYVFNWEEPGAPQFDSAIILGITTLVNHSHEPNAAYERDYTAQTLTLRALRDIADGEEVTIDYGIPLWFEARE